MSDAFVAYLLTRNIQYEEDLVDQFFNSSEKRMARMLRMLVNFGKEGAPKTVVPKISPGDRRLAATAVSSGRGSVFCEQVQEARLHRL